MNYILKALGLEQGAKRTMDKAFESLAEASRIFCEAERVYKEARQVRQALDKTPALWRNKFMGSLQRLGWTVRSIGHPSLELQAKARNRKQDKISAQVHAENIIKELGLGT